MGSFVDRFKIEGGGGEAGNAKPALIYIPFLIDLCRIGAAGTLTLLLWI